MHQLALLLVFPPVTALGALPLFVLTCPISLTTTAMVPLLPTVIIGLKLVCTPPALPVKRARTRFPTLNPRL